MNKTNFKSLTIQKSFEFQQYKSLHFEISYITVTTDLFYRYADQVSVGDEVLLQVKDELAPAKVTNVSNVILQGKYLLRKITTCPFSI